MNLFEACFYAGIARDYLLHWIYRIDPAKVPPVLERTIELSQIALR